MPARDDYRPFKLTSPLGPSTLLFARLTGDERLGEPFRYEIDAVSEKGDIEADDLLGQPVVVECQLPDSLEKRWFHGLVSDFSQQDYGIRFHEYRLTLRPWFWFLTRSADCRVFQDKTVPEIFQKVVKDLGFSDFRLNLQGKYQKFAYCVQYRETAFNFLSRLLEQEGIYYYFEHAATKHTLVLVDDFAAHKATPGYENVPYFPPTESGNRRTRDHLTSWNCVSTVQPGAYAMTDFDLKTPSTSLLKKQSRTLKHVQAKGEIFDYPADLPVGADTESTALVTVGAEYWAKVRLQELQAAHKVAQGQGDAVGLAAGTKFTLAEHPRDSFNREYLVVGTRLSFEWNAHQAGDSADAPECHVAVEAIELQTQFRPPRVTPKPVIHGGQTATVVGKSGEEIDTDDLGRIKIQFHWDREGKKDEDSSCRVRVAQAWAGKNWGTIHIPRIGQEVVVSFLEGDPDRPLVTGSVYNGDQKPPYTLPTNATQSGIKSHSSKGGGDKNFNEIRFEDKKGEEVLHIHAEKDLTIDVENDATWRIGLSEDAEKTGEGDLKLIVGNTVDAKVNESINVKVANTFVKVDAGQEITLVSGASKINLKQDGTITIECVKLQVKANASIEMKANATVKIEGTAQVEVKGAMAKVDASGMLDLNAGGIATLKGVLTKIG